MPKLKKPSLPRLLLRRVVGRSMVPALREGQVVVAITGRRVCLGTVVMIRHHNLEKIKRVHQVQDGRIFVLGDNMTESTDSRQLGWLSQETVVGSVIWPRIQRKIHSGEAAASPAVPER